MTSHDATYPAKISELAPSPNNPRTIDDVSADGLRASLAEMGDISSLVFNLRLGTLVAGHQRVEQLRRLYGHNLAIVPPKDGSDRGYIECPNGDLFAVRFVDWDATRHNAAMLAANSPLLAGEFTAEAQAMLAELEQTAGEMFEQLRLQQLGEQLGLIPPEFQPVGADEQGRLDQKTPIICPECGHEFTT